jgi:hypothetical protein
MRKIDWCHPACLWRHWQVWKYHRSIDKWKGYKLRKKIRRYEKVRKRYEVRKMVRSYEKGTKLRKRYEKVTKRLRNRYERRWLRSYLGYEISYERPWVLRSYQVTRYNISYEKGTKLRKGMKRLRRCYEISYERTWLQSYQVTITTFCTTTKKITRGKTGPLPWLRSIPVKRPPLGRMKLRMRRTYFRTGPLLVTWLPVAPPQILICPYPYITRVYQQENKIRLACFYLFIYFVIVIFFCVP